MLCCYEGRVLTKTFDYLFKRHRLERRWIYIIIFGLLFLLAWMGTHYNIKSVLLYLIPATLSIVQYLYPTVILWGTFFFLAFSSAGFYLYAMAFDMIKLITGVRPSILVDTDDSIIIIAFVCILVWIVYILFVSRPQLRMDGK